jgi:hypothetical protein
MQEVINAFVARANADATLIDADHLDGLHFYSQRGPDVEVNDLKAWCEIWTVVVVPDGDLPVVSEVYQIDTYSATPPRASRVAKRLREMFHWDQDTPGSGLLPGLQGRTLAEPVTAETSPGDQLDLEQPRTLHHRPLQFRVTTYPAD